MQYSLTTKPTYSLASITKAGERTAKVLITVDIHEKNSAAIQAVGRLYPEVLLSGAGTMTREAFLHKVNLLGGSISIAVEDGNAHFTLRASDENLPKLTKLFVTLMQSPTFPDTELKRAKIVVKNELHESRDDSKAHAQEGLRNALYGEDDRRYCFPIDSLLREADKVTKKALQSLHASITTHFWHVSVAGNAATVKDATKMVETLKAGQQPTQHVPVHVLKPQKDALHVHHIPGRQNIDFSIGLPVPITVHHPDFIPLSFGIAVLAKWGGFAGRLMSTVREKEGFTYGIYGRLEGFEQNEQGYFRIMTFFAPQKAVAALTATFREISKLYQSGITQKEFTAFQTILKTQQQLLNDSLSRLLSDLHVYHCQGFDLEEMRLHKERMNSVTRQEINRAIAAYLNPSKMYVSGAGPVADVEKDLQAWMKTMA